MAEDAVDHAIVLGHLDERPCVTRELRVHNPGSHDDSAAWFARHEMARTVEDVLARRTRLLFLDARAALARAPQIARELAQELGRDEAWQQSQLTAFQETAKHFMLPTP
jgi:glycerol-3-phosphate dehydrogenase